MNSLVEIQTSNEVPLYNIGVVSRMTGISMATLRAWERRYDFPESKRTLGGHRLYSERDILHLRWVKQRIDEGMQTAQAIQALRYQEQTGQAILTKGALAAGQRARVEPFYALEKADREDRKSYFTSVKERVLDALIHRNTQSSDELLAETLVLFSPESLILDVIRPVMNEIGTLWENGEISVATEHLVTNYLRQRLIMWMVGGPPTRSQHSIVLACAPEEWHEGSLLIMGAILRRRLWPVIYLGQAVPLADLSRLVQEMNPSLVVMIAMTENSAVHLMDWTQWMPEAATRGRPILGFGGLVFVDKPEWRLKVPGIYLGSTFEEGILTIEKLLRV
jgi:DNA-binding transcriptional MerR regulator